MQWGGMEWIDVAQDRDRWGALMNALMIFKGPLNAGNLLNS
jgi:hypothetical protein